MADQKISQLTEITAPVGSEMLPIVSGGVTDKITTQNVANLALKTVKVIVSSAEILALNTTPKILVAAPGAGKILNILNVSYRVLAGGAGYVTNVDLSLSLGGGTDVDLTADAPLALGSGTKFFSRSLTTLGNGGYAVPSSSNINSPLTLSAPGGNPTGGNGTLNAYITYSIITL